MDILFIGIVCYLMGSIPFGLYFNENFFKKKILEMLVREILVPQMLLRTGNKIHWICNIIF